MPGIFGLIIEEPLDLLKGRILRGVRRLLRYPWHHANSHYSPPLGIAIAMRGKALNGADLWSAPADDLVVAIDGELYAGPPTNNRALTAIRKPTSLCASYIGALYREAGPKWVESVRGAFAVAIWDKTEQKLFLFVDRYGLRPLYYSEIDSAFAFGSNMASFITACPGINLQFDWDAVAEWFTFQNVLGEKTFFEKIRLLPNAGRLCYHLTSRRIDLDQYWTFNQVPSLTTITFEEAVEEACHLFGQAIEEQAAGDNRLGTYLTSGLDSRTIAGYLARSGVDFVTATYGISGCRDMVWGKALARKIGCQHYSFPFENGKWVQEYAHEFLAASEFFVNCIHSHGINTYKAMGDRLDVHLSGFGGGSFAGCDTTTESATLQAISSEERMEELYKDYLNTLGNVFQTPMERANLFQPDVWKILAGRTEASFQAEYCRYAHLREDIAGDAFIVNNRFKKMFTYLSCVERDFFEIRLPFMDYRFLDFIFSIPTSLRLNRKLQLGMLDFALSPLTLVPWQVTATLPTRRVWLRKSYSLSAKMIRLAMSTMCGKAAPFEPGRNSPKWLREDLNVWIRDVLDTPLVDQRGILSRSYLVSLINKAENMEHMPYQKQRNLTYRLFTALTFELMCRSAIDKTNNLFNSSGQ